MESNKRLNALKNLQLQIAEAEAKLNNELSQLEYKHAAVFDTLYSKRQKIVSGEYEPNQEESKWEYEDDSAKTTDQENGGGSSVKKLKTEASTDTKGIPDFWLKVITNSNGILRTMVHDYDEPILRHLRDIRIKLDAEKPHSYTVEFEFNENEYFKNKVLSKTFEFGVEKDEKNPLMYNNNSLYKCVGTKIEWNEGKNITVKTVTKKQMNKKTGNKREVKKEEKQVSFFDFFDTHTPDGVRPSFQQQSKNDAESSKERKEEEDEDELEEIDGYFDLDLEIGQTFKDMLIPKALLYYMGLISGEEEEGDSEFGEEDSDNEDDDDSDEEELDCKQEGKKHKHK